MNRFSTIKCTKWDSYVNIATLDLKHQAVSEILIYNPPKLDSNPSKVDLAYVSLSPHFVPSVPNLKSHDFILQIYFL